MTTLNCAQMLLSYPLTRSSRMSNSRTTTELYEMPNDKAKTLMDVTLAIYHGCNILSFPEEGAYQVVSHAREQVAFPTTRVEAVMLLLALIQELAEDRHLLSVMASTEHKAIGVCDPLNEMEELARMELVPKRELN